MLTMDKQHDIRLRFFRKGERITDIANALQVDRKTVWKYVDKTNFKEPPEAGFGTESMPFDPYKVTIDEWLMKDKEAPRKQRHTAKRVFDRLKRRLPDSIAPTGRLPRITPSNAKRSFQGRRLGFCP